MGVFCFLLDTTNGRDTESVGGCSSDLGSAHN